MPFAATTDDRDNARAAVEKALAVLPVGVTAMMMRQTVEKALKPLEGEIAERSRREQLRRRADEVAARSEELLMAALDEHYEYASYFEKRDHARSLAPQLKPVLRQAVMRGEIEAGDASQFTRSWLEDLNADHSE